MIVTLVYSPFAFFLLREVRFKIFSFAISSAALNDAHCLRSFYTLVRLNPLLSVIKCKFYLYILRSFIVDWCFCSKVDNMTVLFALSVITGSRSIYTIYIPDCFTLCELTFVLSTLSRFSLNFKQYIRAYYEASSVIMAYTHVSLPSSFRFYSTALSCYMKILRIVEP